MAPLLRAFHRLTVDDRHRRASLPARLLAHRDVECLVDAGDGPLPLTVGEIAPDRALGLQILGRRLPLAAGREHVEERVHNFTHIGRPWPAAALRAKSSLIESRGIPETVPG